MRIFISFAVIGGRLDHEPRARHPLAGDVRMGGGDVDVALSRRRGPMAQIAGRLPVCRRPVSARGLARWRGLRRRAAQARVPDSWATRGCQAAHPSPCVNMSYLD